MNFKLRHTKVFVQEDIEPEQDVLDIPTDDVYSSGADIVIISSERSFLSDVYKNPAAKRALDKLLLSQEGNSMSKR